MYIYVQYIVRPGPFTRQLVERMRQDHRVDRTSENCVSMYVFVPSNFSFDVILYNFKFKKRVRKLWRAGESESWPTQNQNQNRNQKKI